MYEQLGVVQSTFSSWEIGKAEPDAETLLKLCKIYEINSINYLLNDYVNEAYENTDNAVTPINAVNEQSLISNYRKLNTEGQGKVDTYTIDLVDSGKYSREINPEPEVKYIKMAVYDEPAAAGIGNYLQGSSFEFMSVPENSVPSGADFGVRISGNSMDPKIKDGSIVWVKSQVSLENGEIGVFVLNNEAYCKRLHIDYANQIG